MKLVVVEVTSNHSEFAGLLFGPYSSEEQAADALRCAGWFENINGQQGNWYARVNRYTSINAVIKTISLQDPGYVPKDYVKSLQDSTA